MSDTREPELLTQTEAARLLRVSDRALRNWQKSGKLTAARVGGKRLYPREKVLAMAKVSE